MREKTPPAVVMQTNFRLFVSLSFRASNMTHKLLPRCNKANSDNLPLVDIVMVANYIAKDGNYISPEIVNVKAIRNGRESYGESAISHVQVKRTGDIYSVICGVAPEHNVTSKSYKLN